MKIADSKHQGHQSSRPFSCLVVTRQGHDVFVDMSDTTLAPIVKICGITQPDHAVAAALSGADMIGVVFARSRRQLSISQAMVIRRTLDRLDRLDSLHKQPLLVGLFVNEACAEILRIANIVQFDIIQLSGDETPADVAECAQHYPVMKTVRFPTGTPVEEALRHFDSYRALVDPQSLRFIVDTYRPGEYGGTGHLADWGIARELARHEDIILAGGLTPGNVANAIKEVAPWGVDVSSGVEHNVAKDPALIKAFIENVRSEE